MPQNRENRAISSQIEERSRNGYEERSKDEAPPTALDDTHACRAPPRCPRLAREAPLGGSQGLDRLNSTKIAESGQIRALPKKGNIKTERPRVGPERPHHPPHRPPRGPMDAPRWAKAPHDQPTCPSPPATACYAHAPVLAHISTKNTGRGLEVLVPCNSSNSGSKHRHEFRP